MKRIFALIVAAGLLSAVPGWRTLTAHAVPQATYALAKSSSGPGSVAASGIYDLANSIGQPAIGEVNAGRYTLGGGFWGGGVIVPVVNHYLVYLPLVLK
jgi:hypothetical protein